MTFYHGSPFIPSFLGGEIKIYSKKMNGILSGKLRRILGRQSKPSAGIVDSQRVKTTEKKGSADMTEVRKLKVGKDTFWWITLDY